jgi:four helix bundle protein
MATANRFEDLDCWQAGRKLKRSVYRLTRKAEFSRDTPLVSQIRRAAFSVTANIVEGFERSGNKEFIQFLAISKGSAGEIKDHLYTALDENYITQTEFEEAYRLADEAGRLSGGFMRYLEHSEMKGSKFASRPKPAPQETKVGSATTPKP